MKMAWLDVILLLFALFFWPMQLKPDDVDELLELLDFVMGDLLPGLLDEVLELLDFARLHIIIRFLTLQLILSWLVPSPQDSLVVRRLLH